MIRSNWLHPYLPCWAAILLFPAAIFSQTISYQNPSSFSACSEAAFSVTVQNSSGSQMPGAVLTLTFTTTDGTACGVQYVPGSVSGASESNITNLGAPQFTVPTLAAGAAATITVQAKADCNTADCIDAAKVFVNNIHLDWVNGQTSVTTTPYVIDRALLIFTNVSSTVMQGVRGDVLQRKFTIRNTRPGALSSFTFTDSYQPGISIASQQGNTAASTPGSFASVLGPADFATVGDGDGLFEFNETLVFVEDITIEDCGLDIQSSVSSVLVSWGCDGDLCQQEDANAIVSIKLYDKQPYLIWEPDVTVPECFCGPDPQPSSLTITNAGDGAALDVWVEVVKGFGYLDAYHDASSVGVTNDAGAPIPVTPIFYGSVGLGSPCEAPSSMVFGFNLSIAEIPPGESVTIHWDQYLCIDGCASKPSGGFWYKYSYYKECPPNIFVQTTEYVKYSEVKEGLSASGFISGHGNSPMMDDSTYTVLFNIANDSLDALNAELAVNFELPCGFEWVPTNELLLGGQAPASLNVSTGPVVTTVTATYLLPLDTTAATIAFDVVFHCDEVCLDSLLCEYELVTSCPKQEECFPPVEPDYFIDMQATLRKCPEKPDQCNLQACTKVSRLYDCPLDSVCIDAPPGYLHYSMTAYRDNYGLPDNNNDNYAEPPPAQLDMSLVARKRLMAGDTIIATLRGAVVVDEPGGSLPYGTLSLHFFGDVNMRLINTDSLFRPEKLPVVDGQLRIWDKSTNVWYECNNPGFTSNGALVYRYDLKAASLGPCVPPNFVYEDGDSIIFVGRYRINYNLKPEPAPDIDPLLGNVIVNPAVLMFDDNVANYTPINCDCYHDVLELTGYYVQYVPGNFALPPCDTSSYVTATGLSVQIHSYNFFPYEYRNIVTFENLTMTLPPSVEMVSTQLNDLRFMNGPSVASLQELPFSTVGQTSTIDLTQYQTPPLEEGLSMIIRHRFTHECTDKLAMPLDYAFHLNFAPGIPGTAPYQTLTSNANNLRPHIANLSLSAPLFDIISFSNLLELDFKLKNIPTVVGNQPSGPAPNGWMYATSQTGLVTNFQLVNQSTGQPVPSVNGVWQLGSIPVSTDGWPYRLIATNNSCDLEHLQIHFGWSCDPITSVVQAPCYEQVQAVSILSPPGEIDMVVNSPDGCSQLCDTIPGHSIEVFNAQLGSVYDLRVKALLPPGMNILSGSCTVEYPTGSGNIYPIGDPAQLSTGTVEWNLSVLFDSLANGLPGVGEAPYNSLTLNFLGESTCDFVADAYLLFIAAAKQNCGTPTNTVAKPGDPVCIEGVNPTLSTNISVNSVPGFGCNDFVNFEVTLTSTDTLPQGACLIVTLPQGVSYQPGSCQNLCPSPLNCTPTVNGDQLTWALPAGVPPSQALCFKLTTIGWRDLPCGNGVVLFQTATPTQALCAATGDSCSVKVSTGSLILPYDIERPVLELSNFEVTVEQVTPGNIQVLFTVDITNTGAPGLPQLQVSVYQDWNGDGVGDHYLSSAGTDLVLGTGQTVTIGSSAGPVMSDTINLCQLIVVLDTITTCACASDVAQIATPIVYQTNMNWTVCSGANQTIGLAPMPGFDYQWTPDDCIASPQSATTNFNCVNDGLAPETYQFTLLESNGFCEIQNLMEVTVQPVPGIAYFDSPICVGNNANLFATDGSSYNWQGPGITQPNQQLQTVMPAVTSTYTVTVVDDFGCVGTESATVVVSPLPSVNAGADEAFCPGEQAQLNATVSPGVFTLWSPQFINGQPTLSSPLILDPVVLLNQTTTFVLTATDPAGCSAKDTVTISFADTLLLTMPPDVTICEGGSVTLTALTNVPATFTWSPAGNCLNPPSCSSILVTPSTTTTYTAFVTTADSCSAVGNVTVFLTDDQIVVNGPTVEICEGETAVINGEVVSAPGIYCDTFMVAGGCDSLYCVELVVKPGIDTTTVLDTICFGESVIFEGATFEEAGLHCVTFTAPNGCDSTRCLLLSVFGLPVVEIVGADTVSAGDTLVLTLEPSGPFGNVLWFANDSLLADCSGQLTCSVFPTADSTTYSVEVTGPDGNCSGTDELAVTALQACNPELVEVPNVFSPNGDELNETFTLVGPGSEAVLNMRIWNRWGEKVYDGPGPWDGKQKGKPAASDVYVYLIKVGCAIPVDDLERELKGDVTLLR